MTAPTILATIEGCPIYWDGVKIWYTAKAADDTDGTGNLHGDPCAQRTTSLKKNGVSLNADVDRYTVVPPVIIRSVPGIVLGCRCVIKNKVTGVQVEAVVGDVGPAHKLGENSNATNAALGVNPSPTTGGDERHLYEYQLWPGVPAEGYSLQRS